MCEKDRVRGLFEALTPAERDKVQAVFAADLALAIYPSPADLEAVVRQVMDARPQAG